MVKDAPGAAPGYSIVSTTNPGATVGPVTGVLASIASIDASFHQPASAIVASPQSTEANKWSGGPWVRLSGGSNLIKSTGTQTTFDITDTAASRVRTAFQGVQAGSDIGILNMDGTGWNGHVGVTGGEIDAKSNEQLRTGSVKFRVPFVGLYGVVTKGGFFADTTIRHDMFSLEATSPIANLLNTKFGGSANNINSSAGYYVPIGDSGYFVEPSAGVSVTRSKFDSLTIGSNTATPGVVAFDTVKSLLTRLGIRGGTSWVVDNKVVIAPFATLSMWHEFEKNAGADVNFPASQPIPVTVTRVGTFYQLGLGASFQVLNTGALGFLKLDLRSGDKIEGWSLNGGARYTFTPG
jgi:outer membrane autotransporter protein